MRNLSIISATVSSSCKRSNTTKYIMSVPPSYTSENRRQKPPPYRASHAFANSAEELVALQQFAESKRYINPGTDGTLPDIASGVKWVAQGGMRDAGGEQRREEKEMRKKRKAESKQREREEVKAKAGLRERLKKIVSTDKGKEETVVR